MYQFKRGSTFSYGGQLKKCVPPAVAGDDPTQEPLNLTGCMVTCDIRTSVGDKLTDHITVTIFDAVNGLFGLKCAASKTVLWRTMIQYLDLKVVNASNEVIYSNTVPVNVVERYTR